ncbi:gram-negative bacteria-binding protein 1-2 isoform X2 [Neodiprion pinetum]|uniref:gram-negative bacteria-binding protein 1-2 isoform X2 n=1 Tax=Neodiprion pinetum TaxID=441929 RepID=UPI001EDCBB48|nr:beta-1,3-glucan-binding protein 1-like isoform X2 [Neodiprion pinetum]
MLSVHEYMEEKCFDILQASVADKWTNDNEHLKQSTYKMRLQIHCGIGLIPLVLHLLTPTISTAQYVPPNPTIIPLYPKGLRLSIPNGEGISLVAYHVKFNEEFYSLEAGTIAVDIIKPRRDQWTYEDRTTRIKIGDTIYLWMHVVYEGLGYNLLDQSLTVTQLYNYDGTPHVTVASCNPSNTIFNGSQPCTGQILFEDYFNELEPSKWRTVKRFTGPPDYEFVVYTGNDENLVVRDGELRIKPTLLDKGGNENFIRRGNMTVHGCTGQVGSNECYKQAISYSILPPVASGLIDTQKSFNFQYGRVEVRAKLPQGDWIYPIIKLLPINAEYVSGYTVGEFRLASAVGNRNLRDSSGADIDGHELKAGAVVSKSTPIEVTTMSKKRSSSYWGDDYHIYELEWTPTAISVKVDGESFGEKAYPQEAYVQEFSTSRNGSPNSVFDKPFYISIGVAVGGQREFPDNCTSGEHHKPWGNLQSKALLNFYTAKDTWKNTWTDEGSILKVDYVKVWAL